ncbi:small membrane A-kinase anchor protein isoform X2 [Nerophis lumbriciformis]|uniref:small membrane A-kinase anchor protein isoform X2 n=1 Tax=Nerophis lumbriciformis TaxID=546530 RepID=UPI002ADFF710|nr:uncharacterized protein LOC133574304 isoform X2 [Nerophis lumbriciformis]
MLLWIHWRLFSGFKRRGLRFKEAYYSTRWRRHGRPPPFKQKKGAGRRVAWQADSHRHGRTWMEKSPNDEPRLNRPGGILQRMGCVKSKGGSYAEQDGRRTRGDKAHLVRSESGLVEISSPGVDPALLDYAQKLSEEIMTRAVQQWVEVDRRYSDIPYIECDVP